MFESIFDMQAPMLQPVGGMDRIAEAIYAQVRPSVRLSTPVTAIRRVGNRVRVEHGAAATEADYRGGHASGEPAREAAQRLLAGQEGGAEGHPISAERQGGVRGAALLGDRRLPLWRPRLDRSAQRERHLPFGRLPFAQGRAGRRLCRRLDQPGQSAEILVPQRRRAHPDQPGEHRGASPRQVAAVGQALVGRLGNGRPGPKGVGAVGPNWGPGDRGSRYAELLKPEGPITFAGEHLSYAGLWQEGAALCAHEALKIIQSMAAEKKAAA